MSSPPLRKHPFSFQFWCTTPNLEKCANVALAAPEFKSELMASNADSIAQYFCSNFFITEVQKLPANSGFMSVITHDHFQLVEEFSHENYGNLFSNLPWY